MLRINLDSSFTCVLDNSRRKTCANTIKMTIKDSRRAFKQREPPMSSSQDDFTDTSDTELVKLAKAGNAHAFAQLFQRYKQPVRRYLTGLLENSENADD